MSSDNIENIANINQRVEIDHIEIFGIDGKPITITQPDILRGEINKSPHSYVEICYCQLNNKSVNVFPLFGRDSEVKVFVKESSSDALFYGIVKKKRRNWDKSKELDITEFVAHSFASIASLKMLYSWEMKYTNGYGEIIRSLTEIISLDSNCTFENNNKGYVYFDHMSVLDVMRFLAYLKGWCLSFKGKTVKFAPCEKPKHSGITINLQDVPTGSITEE